jgi:DNA-binding GntR family transcriptional regulator
MHERIIAAAQAGDADRAAALVETNWGNLAALLEEAP